MVEPPTMGAKFTGQHQPLASCAIWSHSSVCSGFTSSPGLSSYLLRDKEGDSVTSGKTTSLHSQTKEEGKRFGNVCGGCWPHLFSESIQFSRPVLFWNSIDICPVLMSPLTRGFCCRVKEITAFIAQALMDRIIYSIATVCRIIQELERFFFFCNS